MRIVLLSDNIPPEHNGGAEKIAWSLARGLKQAGHDVHVIAATRNTSFEEVRDDICTYHIHVNYPKNLQSWACLYNPQVSGPMRDLLKRIQPDVLHAHNVHNALSFHSLSQSKQLGIPVVFTAHDAMSVTYGKMQHFINPNRLDVYTPSNNDYHLPPFYNLKNYRFRYNPFRNLMIRHIMSHHVDRRLAVSNTLRKALEANNLPSFRTIHNGVEPMPVVSAEVVNALREQLGLQNKRVVLVAGRLNREKGIQQIFEAMRLLVQRLPNAMLLVLTSKPLKGGIYELPQYQSLMKNHVCHGGWLNGEALIAAYQLTDVVTVPSIYLEPFATINIEGMAAHKPVIATCFGGSSEVVQDNITGYVINPFDSVTFADRLESLLTNSNLEKQMGDAGYQRFQEAFTLDCYVNRMIAVYEELV